MIGTLYIVSAPSGAGKTSLVQALLAADNQVRKSVSYTTRKPRPGEMDGRAYRFVDVEEFERMSARGVFLESATVHGNRYGTSREWVQEHTGSGQDVVLEIDWQGAAQVRPLYPGAVSVFILPPSLAALEARLRDRAQDGDEVIRQRLAAAPGEIAHFTEFDYVIINEDFHRAAQDLASIIRAERLKLSRQRLRRPDIFDRMK
jgi:guanylate kinase